MDENLPGANILELKAELLQRARSLAFKESDRLPELAEFIKIAGKCLSAAYPLIKRQSKRLKLIEKRGDDVNWHPDDVRLVYADMSDISQLSEELGLQTTALKEFLDTLRALIEKMNNLHDPDSE